MPLTTLKASNFIDDSVTVGKLSATGTASSSTYLRGDNTWTAVAGLSGLYNATTTTSYTVTVAASKFVIDGVSQDTIGLTEGYTAIFDVSDSSVSTHILRFATAADAAGSTEYSGGVKAEGTPGTAGAKVFFTVPENAPTLYYYCTAHSSMGGTATTAAPPTKSAGDMWVDRGILQFARSGSVPGGGAWVTQSTLNNPRYGISGGGSLSAAISFCGYSASPAGITGATETWDGSTWTLESSCTASDVAAGAGTQTAALVFGGWASPNALTRSEEYDGTSWTAGGNISIGGGYLAGCGTQTAALKFSGNKPSNTSNTTEEYNGTSWSLSNNMNTMRAVAAGDGKQTAAICAGGCSTGYTGDTATTELYDGTSWSNSSNITAGRGGPALAAGNSSAGLICGGFTGAWSWINITNIFDGTTWTLAGNLVTTRGLLGAVGTPQQSLNFGGHTGPGGVNTCESREVPIAEFIGI